MIWTVILIVFVVSGIIVLGWIFAKKLPQLRIIDPNSLPETKSKKLKQDIIRSRVERAGGKQIERIQKNVVTPVGKGIQDAFRRIAGKLTAVERRYQERQQKNTDTLLSKDQLAALTQEGKKLMEEEHWDRAEKKFIEVISNDSKNTDAYEQLGRLYLMKKDFDLAKQTFAFLKKLAPKDPSVIAALGEVEDRLGFKQKALKHFKAAHELSPNNPRYLDFYISSLIIGGEAHEAMSVLDELRRANPDNKKIEVFEKQIDELKQKTKETK
jgi:Flp pilus assembly protein TadD